MSRFYELIVKAKGLNPCNVENLIVSLSDWSLEICSIEKDVVITRAKGYLYAQETEADVHDELCAALKKIKPRAKIGTRWTYLKDMPFSEYGDDDVFE